MVVKKGPADHWIGFSPRDAEHSQRKNNSFPCQIKNSKFQKSKKPRNKTQLESTQIKSLGVSLACEKVAALIVQPIAINIYN